MKRKMGKKSQSNWELFKMIMKLERLEIKLTTRRRRDEAGADM